MRRSGVGNLKKSPYPARSFLRKQTVSNTPAMQPADIIALPEGWAKILSRAELENCAAWKSAFRNQCKDHRFYELIEQTLKDDFEYQYLLLQDSTGKVRAVQPLFFVRQNVCEGLAGKMRRIVDSVQRIFPRFLTMRVLMVGCAVGESHLGVCFPEDRDRQIIGARCAGFRLTVTPASRACR